MFASSLQKKTIETTIINYYLKGVETQGVNRIRIGKRYCHDTMIPSQNTCRNSVWNEHTLHSLASMLLLLL